MQDHLRQSIAKTARLNADEVEFALADVKATLDIWKDRPTQDEYVAKLLFEFDELCARKRQLARRPHCPTCGRLAA